MPPQDPPTQVLTPQGFRIYPGLLAAAEQAALVEVLREVVRDAPLSHYHTPQGKPMSVAMTAAGRLGWVSDAGGYRYARQHPSGVDWPAIPGAVLAIWDRVADCPRQPDCCLINHYGAGARMGLHQDRDEADFTCPVVSVSLGDDGLFRMGGTRRSDATASHWLKSGDVVVKGGSARLAYHGVDRIRQHSSALLAQGGRINLTLRVVT